MPVAAAARGLSAAAALVRAHDRDRFQTALFAPASRREALFALYAFNYEIARVRDAVREPMLGHIRLQWWREAVETAFSSGAPRGHQIVLPLTAAIREYGLDRGGFDRLIDSRERDLDDEPPPTLAALEDYAAASSGALAALAAALLGARKPAAQDAAEAVGTGYALAGLLRAAPYRKAAGRPALPPGVGIPEIAAAARRHLARARADRRAVPRAALAALLPAVIASHYLRRLERAGCDPFAPELANSDPLQSWRLLAAALRNRF